MIWIILAILGVVGWVLTLITHEMSHALVNKIAGRTITEIKLWPHFHNGKFYFGRVSSTGGKESLMWVHTSPLLKGVALSALWIVLAIFYYEPLFVLAGAELIDMLWWFKGFLFGPDYTDGAKFRRKI